MDRNGMIKIKRHRNRKIKIERHRQKLRDKYIET